ncbi:MAG: hypothetical protein JWM53_5504 [bacterium]|nr:hypothetical protein [bacterium]
MQIVNAGFRAETELDYLRFLDDKLREAIGSSLIEGRPHLAVTLDTARDALEAVLSETDPTATRVAVARARAEIALEVWREAIELRH